MSRSSFREVMDRRVEKVLGRVGDRGLKEDGTPVFGVFENPSRVPNLAAKGGKGGLSIQANTDDLIEPTFGLPAAVADGLPKGSTVTIDLPPSKGGGVYEVVRHEPDGSDWIALVLKVKHARTADIFT